MEKSYDLKLMPSIPDTTSFSHATRVRITNSASITKCLLLNRGDDLLREKGGVGERRAACPSERPGVGGGARPDWRSVLEVGRRRQEGRGRRTPSRAATPSAGGRGALRAHTPGQRHPAQAGGVALALAR